MSILLVNVWRRALLGLFFLSGISGLLYEVAWTRMLHLLFGDTVLAVSTVLASFMAGLALGSFWSGRYVDRRPRVLGVYAALEAGIAVSAVLLSGCTSICTTPSGSSAWSASSSPSVCCACRRS
jgi:spermidine synthase